MSIRNHIPGSLLACLSVLMQFSRFSSPQQLRARNPTLQKHTCVLDDQVKVSTAKRNLAI